MRVKILRNIGTVHARQYADKGLEPFREGQLAEVGDELGELLIANGLAEVAPAAGPKPQPAKQESGK